MAYHLNILPTAQAEADIILNYLKTKNEKAADNFYKELHNIYKTIAEGIVDFGLSRFPELAIEGYHNVFFDNYVILYVEEGDNRTIAHIFHQKQDYASLV